MTTEVKTTFTMTDEEKLKEYKDAEQAAKGTVFSFTENEGTWFLFDEKDPTSAEICLRSLTLEEVKEMRRRFIKTKVVYKKDQRYAFEEPDVDGQNEFIWTRSIVSWRRVLDSKRQEVPCTDEMKMYMMNKVPSFLKWVTRCMTMLGEADYEQVEVERKN